MGTLHLDQTAGSLSVRTGVEGRASRMGHRLTLAVGQWEATVQLDGARPLSFELTAILPSLQVLSGDGGVTPVTPVDKAAIKRNALKSLHAEAHPRVRYEVDACDATADGFDLRGVLTINGVSSPKPTHIAVTETDDGWALSAQTTVIQSDFDIKPYSLMVGALRVSDEVTVEFKASVPRASVDVSP